MKKQILSFILATLLLVLFCGCGGDTEVVTTIVDETSIADTTTSIEINNDDTATSNAVSDELLVSDDSVANSTSDTESDMQSGEKLIIDYTKTVEIDICDDFVRAYLSSNDPVTQYYWLNQIGTSRSDYQNIKLDWSIDESSSFTLYFSENADFSNAITIKSKNHYSTEIDAGILIPGKTYYWKAMGEQSSDPLGGGKIKVADTPARWIYIDGIKNVRDMGGWKTESGKVVKYGMLYRGSQLNTERDGAVVNAVTDKGLETFNKLGIKTEFDLRSMQNVHEKTAGTNLNYILFSSTDSDYIGYDGIAAKSQKEKYIKMFEYLSDESNYPIYTHCQGGADRTGTYAFLLNGLLGVSYDDLVRDFELTSFAGTKRWRSAGSGNSFNPGDTHLVDNGITIKWKALYDYIMEYGRQNKCTTLQQSIEHWFVNYVGVPKEQIDSFKSIMLE